MALSASAAHERRRFRLACANVILASLAVTVLLLPVFPLSMRESVTGAGLLLAGALAAVAGVRRAWISSGADRRPWLILTAAAAVAIVGNLWVSASGSDPTTSPSIVSIVSIAVALVLTVWALLSFPMARRRGPELVVTLLDGLVAGGAFLLIASVTAFSELLESSTSTSAADRITGIAFPALDVLLATVAVLLVVRASRADRQMLVLLTAAFLLYAASDLSYAVRMARGTFHFGTLQDLGWIIGYLLLALSTMTPRRSAEDTFRASLADALGTTLVFSVLAVATLVQVLFGTDGRLQGAQSALWVVIVVAAGVRQVLLTADNSALRRGLEQRVEEQTAGLRRLARQNEVLITSVGDGVYGVDHQGRVTFVNPSGARALGYTPEELEGRHAHDLFHAPDQDGTPYPWVNCYAFEAITHGLVASAEEDEYVRADGTVFPVEITASPLLDETEVRGAVVVFRDVTQRREVDRMKDEFLSVVSHELRTPLTSIRGSLGLLAGGRMGEMPERAGSLINVAVQSTERLTRLINDLLDIERMESGARPIEMSALDAHYLLESAVHQIEGMATSLGVNVEVVEACGRVLADEDRTIQTLLNLTSNAIKFSERGSTVRLYAAEEGDEVHFRVSDDGRGIPADKLSSVFERFEQVDSSDTRQKGGTGLGLTISKGIVERHGGRIWAESELGVGTTVHFTLPAAIRLSGEPEQPPGEAPARPARLLNGSSVAGGRRNDGASVLLVEDDEALSEVIATLLADEGLDVIRATSAAEAIASGDGRRPDVIVLDVRLPDGNGADVVAAFRRQWSLSDTPVVVYSVVDIEADRRDRLQLGTTVFLNKGRTSPEQLRDEVLDLVEVVTGHNETSREGGHDGPDPDPV
jgi:PAS domain S-box-containing protein